VTDAASAGGAAARPVRVLPEDLANQIAAGEVVERPSSVVKELCENAVDAGATRVAVEVDGGGVDLCRVIDDGAGMTDADARLAVLRHATSKIASVDDLARIGTLGFRGEALPSIASVSRFSLRTRRRGADAGAMVRIDGGSPPLLEPAGGPAGTTVEVRDLFYNVPARRKFLRAAATESAHVAEVVQALALAEPGLAVTLVRDGRAARDWPRAGGREARVRDVLKGEPLVACRGARGPLAVEAFLAPPERSRAGSGSLWMLVNGRPVRDRAVARAVAHAYGSVMPPGRYPIGVVFLDLPLELVDVNVHPQKAEVRFADGRAVFDAIVRILGTQLAAGLGPRLARGEGARPGDGGEAAATPPSIQGAHAIRDARGPSWLGTGADAPAEWSGSGRAAPPVTDAAPLVAREAAGEPRSLFSGATFIAQVRRPFLLCETPEGLVFLDQHAAAERVTFDRLRRAYAARAVASQWLLVPEIVRVGPADVALVEEAGEVIAQTGLEVRAAGPDAVAVHAVPQLLARARPEALARDLLAELGRAGGRAWSGAIDLALATMACHGSVRAGDEVSADEARALLAALAEVDFAGHCPHGRSVVHRLGWPELYAKVGR
jgi:DNA mismatch repair protein MutL